MNTESLQRYSVGELNAAIGSLLDRGFEPRFLLYASVSKPQLKNGHLWLTLTDGDSSISGVIWASTLRNISFRPNDSDGVLLVGKINFWRARASLVVQIIDIRPSIATVLRQFEVVKEVLNKDGLLDPERRKAIPQYPTCLALLTSVPSSALADMLRTSKERWPLAKVLIFPIPVQGPVAFKIKSALSYLISRNSHLGVEVIVLARGGGSREDLMVFDDEGLCRLISNCPIPVITGLGHEDDITVADLVADHRAATPTAAIISALPSRTESYAQCFQRKERLNDYMGWLLRNKRSKVLEIAKAFEFYSPLRVLAQQRATLMQKRQLLFALSPDKLLSRGFAIVKDSSGVIVKSIKGLSLGQKLNIKFLDGNIESIVEQKNSKSKTYE